MDNIRILLCCGAGMSSGFLASNARKIAKKKKMNVSIEARSYSEAVNFLSSIDILMLGPHFASELSKFQELADVYGVVVTVIPENIYATLDGEKLINLAISLLQQKKDK